MVASSGRLQSLVIITGMSGSGKHTVANAFEDLGYFCVDNLPTALLSRLIRLREAPGRKNQRLGIVVDVRLGESAAVLGKLFRAFKRSAVPTRIIFVEASDEVLARRYNETRRVHPLARNRSLLEGIRAERRKLERVRPLADLVIDTSDFSVHDLRGFIDRHFSEGAPDEQLHVSLVSFGYKFGIPHNTDLIFDVRFLPNPNFVPHLKVQTGNDPEVIQFMKDHAETEEILVRIEDMLEYLLPRYKREGKTYLTVAIGCTGGRHRSVVISSALKERLERKHCKINLVHRDLHNE